MKYNDVDPVVVLLPPDAQGQPGGAVLLRKDELKEHLDRPLTQTLPTGKQPTALGITDLEAATIDYLTLRNKFVYQFRPASDGTAHMLLNPDRPAG
jgi:hypothetical protein